MHKIKVLTLGLENFNTSLEELKENLNFELYINSNSLEKIFFNNFDVLLIHESYLQDISKKKKIQEINKIKILVSNSRNINSNIFTNFLLLPTSIKDINQIIEKSVIKENFSINSSIKIKDYILDKNEKKLTQNNNFILLTEKEIQLLELLLNENKAINKSKILNLVWKYASEADTHTVETHIYRLRKKIKAKFSDENFILNNEEGYLL